MKDKVFKVYLYNGDCLQFSDDSTVLDVLTESAESLHISPYYIKHFCLQSKLKILVPYRKHVPFDSNEVFYFSVFNNLPLNEVIFNDFESLTYYYKQCNLKFRDVYINQCIDENTTAELLIWLVGIFARSCGLSMKKPDLLITIKKFIMLNNNVYSIDLQNDEIISQLVQIDNDKLSYVQCLKKFIEVFKNQVTNKSDEFMNIRLTVDNVLASVNVFMYNKTMRIIFLKDNKEIVIKHRELKHIICNEVHTVIFVLINDIRYKLHFQSLDNQEHFISILDYHIRSLDDSRYLITFIYGIPLIDLKLYNTENEGKVYRFIDQPICLHKNVSSKELKSALESYGYINESFGVIEVKDSFKLKKERPFYLLVYCINQNIYEKIIYSEDELYYFEDSPHRKYTTIKALVKLFPLRIPPSPVIHSLKNQITDDLLMDIQDSDMRKVFIPESSLKIFDQEEIENSSVLSSVYNGEWGKHNKYSAKYFEYKDHVPSEEERRDFISHASTLTKLKSENYILRVYGIRNFFVTKFYNYITEDMPFYTLYEHLLATNTSIRGYGYTQTSLLYGRYIASGLVYLHTNNIFHSFPAPQHVLLNKRTNHLKLFDIGAFGKVFKTSASKDTLIQRSALMGLCVLRWMNTPVIEYDAEPYSAITDRWVFACTLWQIFNNGRLPLSAWTDEELIERYRKIKDDQVRPVHWFRTELPMPDQKMVLYKKLQKLVNYILTHNDQNDEFDKIAELYNKYIFPDDTEINLYEELEDNTDITIDMKNNGELVFEKQIIEDNFYTYHLQSESTTNLQRGAHFSSHSDIDSTFNPDEEDCHSVQIDNSNNILTPGYNLPGYEPAVHSSDEITEKPNVMIDDAFVQSSFAMHNATILTELSKFNNYFWDCSCYTLNEEIGKGNFGTVRKATLHYNSSFIPAELHGEEVAVKTFDIPNSLETNEVNKICKEARNMVSLKHERIVPFYAISHDEMLNKIHIIMPLYKLGCLKKYLSNCYTEIKCERLISFGLQIAEGMEYLSKKGFVHRDLALRNILVEQPSKVCIADLGLSREVATDYYYILTDATNSLPFLYYPPEFFEKLKFDKYADVWSYGVTCFEMFTYGRQVPYKAEGIKDKVELVKFLAGKTLSIPEDTPPVFQTIMNKCWLPKGERWSFTEIVDHIRSNVTYYNPYISFQRADYDKIKNCEDIVTEVKLGTGGYKQATVTLSTTDSLCAFQQGHFHLDKSKLVQNIVNENKEFVPYDKLMIRAHKITFGDVDNILNNMQIIKHRSVVQIVGYMLEDDVLYTVSPAHSLGTLHQHCSKASSIHIHRKYMYLKQVLEGLLYLLDIGVVHGALSVHNVLLQSEHRAVMCDVDVHRTYTLSNTHTDKLRRLPPEVLDAVLSGDSYTVDHVTDMWMYGVLLWEMFSLQPPYQQLEPEETSLSPDEFKVQFGEKISKFLQLYRPEHSSYCPFEVRKAVNLCFAPRQHRQNISGLKNCF